LIPAIGALGYRLGQKISEVAQRQRVFHVHHHNQTDHFWRAVEISERVAHGPKLPQPKTARKIALTTPAKPFPPTGYRQLNARTWFFYAYSHHADARGQDRKLCA